MAQGRRKVLHKRLEKTINGRAELFFQPPSDIMLSYPCVIYSLEDIYTRRADNQHYMMNNCYSLIVIDTDPDSDIAMDILKNIPKSSFDRRYVKDNLYHDALTIYW